MKKALSAILVALVLAASGAWAGDEGATEQENRLIELVLKQNRPDRGYIVVYPETIFDPSPWDPNNPEYAQKAAVFQKTLVQRLEEKGVPPALARRLFERNQNSVRLAIPSSLNDGYIVDDGTYQRYFEKDGPAGWKRWYEEHPEARGYASVSLPVYDETAGLVLVYFAITQGRLHGAGWVILYRYENGALKELARERLWVS